MNAMRPQEAVERALALSRTDDCIVIADEASTANLRWAGNTLTTNGVTRSSRLTVIALRDTAGGVAAGVVSRSAVGAGGIEDLVRAAEPTPPATTPPRTPGRSSPRPGRRKRVGRRPRRDRHRRVRGFAPALGEAFAAAQAGDRRLYGFANHVLTSTFLGTSAGLRLRHDQPTGLLELNAKGAGGSAWAGVGTRDFTDVDVAALTGDLARRLDWGERRVDLPAGRYGDDPAAVRRRRPDDLPVLVGGRAGRPRRPDGVQRPRRRHPRRGAARAPARHAVQRPGRQRHGMRPVRRRARLRPRVVGVRQRPPAHRHRLDPGWELTSLTQTRHSADRTGLPATPPVDNLALVGPDGGATLEEMVARTERGLLLTCLWYIREVDPQSLLLTGLTRDGVYLVEDGEVVGAVNNFRFNESPVDLLSRLAEVGETGPTLPREWSDYFTRAAMPPVRVPDFNMSTVSQAS